jgi:hypothetical protein
VPFPAGSATAEQIQWLLGTPPPLAFSPGGQYGLDVLEYIEMMLSICKRLVFPFQPASLLYGAHLTIAFASPG